MVGTPQLPLKYRRKGDLDYRVYSPDLDMTYHSPTSSFNPCKFGSECSVPRSPTFFSSSSSNAPSSPIRSLHTPEPPSSLLAEPYIAFTGSPKSPKSDNRKGFWEVAFNYGPDFPYKDRPLSNTSHFEHERFFTRRRSSSASAPALVSDVDPSEYSEDNDPFRMDEDVADEVDAPGNVTFVHSRDELAVALPQDDAVNARDDGKVWDGEIDVAAVLLDLSRQVRLAPLESKAVNVAINRIGSPLPDLVQQETPILASESHQVVKEANALAPVASELQSDSVSRDSAQFMELSNLNEHEIDKRRDFSEAAGLKSENSEPPVDVPVNVMEDHLGSTEELKIPAVSQGTHGSTDISSENIAVGNVETSTAPKTPVENQVPTINESTVNMVEEMLKVDPIVESIFSATLTPISSPVLTASELSDLNEPLSEPSSPEINMLELTGPFKPTVDTRCPKESDELDVISRPSPPVPGPSNSRLGSADQHAAPAKRRSGQSQRGSRKSKSGRGVLDVKANESECNTKKGGKKRVRSASLIESRPSSPISSASCPDIPRPRNKRSRKVGEDSNTFRNEDGSVLTASAHSQSPSSSLITPTLPPHDSSMAPRDTEMDAELPVISEDDDANARAEMCGCLIQAMALSRASSMPSSSLLREVLRENPHLSNQRSKTDWLGVVAVVLKSHDFFGRIDRDGLDADDEPLEAQWFYMPENDPDQDRASLLHEMMPKKRNETKKYKQYFYKPLGKISRWDAEDAP